MQSNNNEVEFAGHVDVFFKVDDELRGVSEEIKDLKSSKSSLEGRIARHMDENGIPETISPSGKIKVYRSKSSAPINKPSSKRLPLNVLVLIRPRVC